MSTLMLIVSLLFAISLSSPLVETAKYSNSSHIILASKSKPEKLAKPGKTDKPGKPGKSDKPAKPGKPGKPAKPGKPGKSDKPAKPGKGDKPGKPGKPAAPVAPVAPTKGTMNPIDACWRKNPNWATQRQALAKCAVGYGKAAMGGANGAVYVVTSPADDVKSPKQGTLRYGAMQVKPLWITFARDMVFKLQAELYVSSHKTIDGRGAKIDIGGGACIRLNRVSNVIIHGIRVHDCKHGPKEKPMDADGIRVWRSTNVWIDHCYLARCEDGLLDVLQSSNFVTISNNHFTEHRKTMLLGHSDGHVDDKKMKVTVAFNRFGPGLVSRMPRVRLGYAHVANNMYENWGEYAIGGSANPTIFSEGNYFVAGSKKLVTKRYGNAAETKSWKFGTAKDVFMKGAIFGPASPAVAPGYKAGEAFTVAPGAQVPSLTANAGPLTCTVGKIC